jgi:DNA-binding transcriptional ArsR family regulator
MKEFEFSSKNIGNCSNVKTFSHPARIQIIDILSKHKDRTCKEIVSELPLSQSTVSQHLKVLDVGIICRKRELTGLILYRIN